MVQFMLEHAPRKLGGLNGHLVAVEVTPNHVDVLGADDFPRQAGHGQAPLQIRPLPRRFDDLGVDQRVGASAVIQIPDKESLLHADLRCRQAKPGGVVHGLDHVVHQASQPPIYVGDIDGTLLEDGVSDHTDLVGRHREQATVATVPHPQPGSSDHYFSAEPVGASAPRQVEMVLPEGRLVRLTTDAGVFSADKIDAGTRVLLAEGPPVANATALADVGCGYGAITIALALRAPGATVWAVDVNERARALCQANAEANGVADRVRVVAPAGVPTDLKLDQLWSNPPIRVGKEALHDLLATWLRRLKPEMGTATLVVQKHLGADSLARWLTDEGWPTQRVVSRGGYRILSVSATTEEVPS